MHIMHIIQTYHQQIKDFDMPTSVFVFFSCKELYKRPLSFIPFLTFDLITNYVRHTVRKSYRDVPQIFVGEGRKEGRKEGEREGGKDALIDN